MKLTLWLNPPCAGDTLRVYVAVCPATTVAELEEPAATASVKSWPVPLSATLCVLPAAPLLLSVMVSVPLNAPVEVGEKVTSIEQEPSPATLPPQLLVWLKLSLMAMLVMVSVASPVLLSVTHCAALMVPRPSLLNVRLAGEAAATAGAVPPIPVKLNV